MTPRLHSSLKPRIVEGIDSSVRTKRTRRRPQTIAKTGAMTHLKFHSEVLEDRVSDSLVATKHCPGCDAGSRRLWQESVTSFLLQERQVSAKPPSSTHSRTASLLM